MRLIKAGDTIINFDAIASIKRFVKGSDCAASFHHQDKLFLVISLVNGEKFRVFEGSEQGLAIEKLLEEMFEKDN